MIADWLANIEKTYSVDPIIFAVLYFGTFIPCWYFVFKIIGAIKKKNIDKLIIYSLIELFLLVLPFLYILIWGRNLPVWVYIILVLLIVISAISAFRAISKKLEKENKSQILWDFCSWAYRNAVGHSISHKKMFDDVFQSLSIKKDVIILDAGCGAGDFEKYILSKKIKMSIEAIDFSAQMIKGAKNKSKSSSIHFRQADLDKFLPFPNNYFDSVICIQVLFTLPRLGFTLKEFYRVLKPYGKLIIAEPRPDANMGKTIVANFKELRNIRGLPKITAFFDLLVRFPLGMIVLFFNLIMDYWQRKDIYHFYSANELKDYLIESRIQTIKIQRTLADQDNLIISEKSF